jgi:hypothetical protein
MQTARILTLLGFLFVWCGTGVGSASACSCQPPPEGVRGADQIKACQFERATDVVLGRIVSVRAGEDTVRGGYRVVVATMRIASTLKGAVAPGDISVLTGFGTGDCGIASFLLVGIAWDRDVTLEVRKIPDLPGEYVVDMCGYGEMARAPNLNLPTR